MKDFKMKFNTKTIHGGQTAEPATGAVMPPIFQTSTYAQTSPGLHQGYDYARGKNPTRHALEAALASLENGKHAMAFGSGLAAIDAVLKTLNPGDEIIATDDIYGGSYRMFTQIFAKYNLGLTFVDMRDEKALEKAVTTKTKLVWIETPTNPMMKITDIKVVCEALNKADVIVAVDNTFASPYAQNPLDLGADLVMHSATKYLGGHSDLIAGALIVNDENLGQELRFQQFAGGAILGPMDSFLVLRGIKTLAIRYQRHSENGIKIAELLEAHQKVESVYYPGLISHPDHTVARSQMRAFGGMVSFTFKSNSKNDAFTFLESLKIFTLAESLGGVESLANYPALMSHGSIPLEKRLELGIRDDLIRLSVGIEDISDLCKDITQALDKI